MNGYAKATFQYPGWRSNLPGGEREDLAHGHLAGLEAGRTVYRGPGPRPMPNATRNNGLGVVPQVSDADAIVHLPPRIAFPTFVYRAPGGSGNGIAPVTGAPVPPVSIVGPVSAVPQPLPIYSPSPAPVVTQPSSGGCTGSNQYRDAAGNCTSDWSNPYSLYLPSGSAVTQPAPTVAADTSPTSSAGVGQETISQWLSDSSIISGLPNWAIAAAAGFGLMMLMRKR